MTKEMIISSNVHETIVAILEDDLVAEDFRRTGKPARSRR